MDMNYIGSEIFALQSCLIWLVDESLVVENLEKEADKKKNQKI